MKTRIMGIFGMGKKMLMIHGGGPTAVMNASLYGAVIEAKKHQDVEIYAAIGGTGGVLRERLRSLNDVPQEELALLLTTPGSAIGTSRDPLEEKDYERMARVLRRHGITHVLCNGGNGSMEMCGKLHTACQKDGYDIGVMGIPKTMDNDLAETDHSPGFGSAARYIARSVQELCADVKGLPIHVVILETCGRNAGWVTAASALARKNPGDGPDLIYLPERPFVEEEFLQDVAQLIEKKKGGVVVVSEGLTTPEGKNIVPPILQVGRSVYYGDVSAYLAGLVVQKLGYKARSEKPGLLGRSSISLQSPVDREEARMTGEMACRAVLAGETGKMVAIRRLSSAPYKVELYLAEIEQVMLTEYKMPDSFINDRGNDVTDAFVQWCAPLLGDDLPQMISWNDNKDWEE